MRITLLQTGKTRDRFIIEGVEEYRKRVVCYTPFVIESLSDLKNSQSLTMKEVQEKEGAKILGKVKTGDYMILLDEGGREFQSIALAEHLKTLESRVDHLVFVIGGSYGFSEEVYSRANEKLSLSRLSFSQELIRLLFMEQIYRSFTILKGEPNCHE
jgi:23S rRNA (pseudouridine1915-N3)-methyltransferase